MEEKNGIDAEKNEPIKEKTHKDKKNDKKSFGNTITHVFNDFKGEFRKIIWPSKPELLKQTVTVIVTSLLFGVIIFGMDSLFGFGMQAFVSLIPK